MKGMMLLVDALSFGCSLGMVNRGAVDPDVVRSFTASGASDPDYLDMLESGDRVEITKRSILFEGDGAVSSMIVTLDDQGRIHACRHLELGIRNDGYYTISSGRWERCRSAKWKEMLLFHERQKL